MMKCDDMLHRFDIMIAKLESYAEWLQRLTANTTTGNFESQLRKRIVWFTRDMAQAQQKLVMTLKFILYHRFMHDYLVENVRQLRVGLHEYISSVMKRKFSALDQLKGLLSSGTMFGKTFQQVRYNSYMMFGLDGTAGVKPKLLAMANYTESKLLELQNKYPIGYEPIGAPQYDAFLQRLVIFDTLKFMAVMNSEQEMFEALMDSTVSREDLMSILVKQKYLMSRKYSEEQLKLIFEKMVG